MIGLLSFELISIIDARVVPCPSIYHTTKSHPAATMANVGSSRGGSRISGSWVHLYKGVGVRFANFISFFLNIQ